MRAFVIEAPRLGHVREVPVPHASEGQVVVLVERAGICGTDVELFSGTMPYFREESAWFPLRPGHEWSGRVIELGDGVDPSWLGAHVTGDTMIGCGACNMCRTGRHHVCAERYEIGIRGGWHGALAERLLVPALSLRRLPESMSRATAALVEPAGNAWRSVAAARLGAGSRVCIWGSGTIGLLCLQFAASAGALVDVVGPREESRLLAKRLGAHNTFHPDDVLMTGYDAVIDATNNPAVPAIALRQVDPGGNVVLVGLADTPALVDSRDAVLRDVTVTGILAASAGLDPAIAAFADGSIDPEPIIDRVVSLEDLTDILRGTGSTRPRSGAPKIHVDPTRMAVNGSASTEKAQ